MNVTYTNILSVEDYNMLHEAVGWGSCNPDRVRNALARTDFLVVAQIDGNPIGMSRVIQDGLQALVMDVIVIPEYQGQGIGKTMMGRVMEYLNELSRGSGILVNLISAIGRAGFYEQFGFIQRPYENRGPGMTLWLENMQ